MVFKIDGSQGEGGGQILRTSLSLASVLGKPVEITNIRSGRKKPGLQPQHLTCVNALAKVTNAEVKGNHIGSTTLNFEPKNIASGNYAFDIGTAGSTTLLLQCLLPPLLFADAPSALTLRGGTDVPFAPPSFFLEHVFTKLLRAMDAQVSVRVPKHGFYPVGGGTLYAKIEPTKVLKPLVLKERGKLKSVKAIALSANLPDHVGQRQQKVLEKKVPEIEVELSNISAPSPGNLVFIQAEYEDVTTGFSSLGEVGKRAEVVAEEAANAFLEFDQTSACLEEHGTDQLLLYAALAKGESILSTQKLSNHSITNLEVLRQMLGVEAEVENNVIRLSSAEVI